MDHEKNKNNVWAHPSTGLASQRAGPLARRPCPALFSIERVFLFLFFIFFRFFKNICLVYFFSKMSPSRRFVRRKVVTAGWTGSRMGPRWAVVGQDLPPVQPAVGGTYRRIIRFIRRQEPTAGWTGGKVRPLKPRAARSPSAAARALRPPARPARAAARSARDAAARSSRAPARPPRARLPHARRRSQRSARAAAARSRYNFNFINNSLYIRIRNISVFEYTFMCRNSF